MQFVTDFHLHSKYSRAVSANMILPVMSSVAKQKGIDILTISDFTHPLWFHEVGTLVEEDGEGIYTLKSDLDTSPTRFICTTEISCIFKQGNKLRRIHQLVFASSLQAAEKIQQALLTIGANLTSDGRPIIGLSSKELLELVMEADEEALLIPAHVWTPHFGLFGSASGFESIEEAFGNVSQYIYGIETGLSSDPAMNWQVPELKNRSILSFSDAHSLPKMGRELTVMDLKKADYPSIRKAIMGPLLGGESQSGIVYTIEFYPEEGKYHFSGHRDCHVIRSPEEVHEKGNICPVCHKKLTEGVASRVQQLSGGEGEEAQIKENDHHLRWILDPEKNHPPFVKMVPLLEIIAESLHVTVASKKVTALYHSVVEKLGNEMTILLKIPISEIEKNFGSPLAEAVRKVRSGDIVIHPGYDNVYGTVKIWPDPHTPSDDSSQMSLF